MYDSIKKWLFWLFIGGTALAAGTQFLPEKPQVSLDVATAKHIQWNKPTTDEGWAEDVKAENFDIKSTPVLQKMIVAHTEKLAREEKAFAKYVEMEKGGQDPVLYIYWGWIDRLKEMYPNEPEAWYSTEARKIAQQEYDLALTSIEKLKQSVERMHKEVELRQKGKVNRKYND
mgnify:CR=1 FL=1